MWLAMLLFFPQTHLPSPLLSLCPKDLLSPTNCTARALLPSGLCFSRSKVGRRINIILPSLTASILHLWHQLGELSSWALSVA